MSGNFTFPTSTEYQFIVADLVNVTWDITAPRLALYETCGTSNRALEGELLYRLHLYKSLSDIS